MAKNVLMGTDHVLIQYISNACYLTKNRFKSPTTFRLCGPPLSTCHYHIQYIFIYNVILSLSVNIESLIHHDFTIFKSNTRYIKSGQRRRIRAQMAFVPVALLRPRRCLLAIIFSKF